jgi:hypothetical protein
MRKRRGTPNTVEANEHLLRPETIREWMKP